MAWARRGFELLLFYANEFSDVSGGARQRRDLGEAGLAASDNMIH